MGAFTGKTVLILGGSRGIGAAIVRRFVTDGANVRFTYAGSKDAAERLAQETGATAVFTDSSDKDWICPYISRHLLSLNPLLARCRRYSRG
ncbi:SDR family NAD(P)-dependent oxidoreductase, partial [Escherichia coli]|uniref:SDR family NAD(P)-dependent oxidoreductase n=1 Tax=Escherichia coli TaxID=562 RepID=UPI0021146040